MDLRYRADRHTYSRMATEELRDNYLVGNLFQAGRASLTFCEVDRVITGGIVPQAAAIPLTAPRELSAEHFFQNREGGLLNIGGPGRVEIDGTSHRLERLDCLYIGRGAAQVVLSSDDPERPARFYLVSYPAQVDREPLLVRADQAMTVELGSAAGANRRRIMKYIHPGTVATGQIVMGVTCLEEGSVWNTMPPHTHDRRTEIYLYFDLAEEVVFHFMGRPDETRHLVVRDGEAVISPQWSIHSGVGTGPYSFCWCMGGENQEFDDMDHIDLEDLR